MMNNPVYKEVEDNHAMSGEDDKFSCITNAIVEAAEKCQTAGGTVTHVIQQLDIPETMEAFGLDQGRLLLFKTAALFSTINVEQSWTALLPGCACLQPKQSLFRTNTVLLGDKQSGWTALSSAQTDALFLFLNGDHCNVVESNGVSGKSLGFSGFSNAPVFSIEGDEVAIPEKTIDVSKTEQQRFLEAQLTLLLGLISGAGKRAVDEAYTYAGERKSGGHVIAQYQAVALRLADLAIHYNALSLFARALVEQMHIEDDPDYQISPEAIHHIIDLALEIARNALQTAAAHGFVSGLPFRTLFEQLRTLTAVLNLVSARLMRIER